MAKITVWERGNVVKLKSGGPKMTVSNVPLDDVPAGKGGKRAAFNVEAYAVTCKWFDGPVLYQDNFDSESLKRAKV